MEPSNRCPGHAEQPFPIGQASTRLLTPALPSLPIRMELVLSDISGEIQQRDLGQSFRVPFPLWPPALAALSLLVIVREVPGRQWAIQRAGLCATSPGLCLSYSVWAERVAASGMCTVTLWALGSVVGALSTACSSPTLSWVRQRSRGSQCCGRLTCCPQGM